jgi:hypothetical protein
MPQKTHKPEEIVARLRQVDVLVSQGESVAEADYGPTFSACFHGETPAFKVKIKLPVADPRKRLLSHRQG